MEALCMGPVRRWMRSGRSWPTTYRIRPGDAVKIEVRAVGLKAMREKRGLTQRKLAHDLGISQNYIPAIEANSRQAGPKLQEQLVKYFRCRVEDLFEVVLVDPESKSEQVLQPRD
jgi:DNA-binding XRE family transcriptional regulator